VTLTTITVETIIKFSSNFIMIPGPIGGASDDWYKGVLGARFVGTLELRDRGEYGFILPADQIIPRYNRI
jgi:hypothetical protein